MSVPLKSASIISATTPRNSSEGVQGLVQNFNLPNMEQILTAILPTSDYIPKDAINAVTQL